MIRLTKKLRDFSSDQIRCGTITFSDISEAKEEKSKVVSMQGQECEWRGFIITAIVVFVVLFLIAKFGNFQ